MDGQQEDGADAVDGSTSGSTSGSSPIVPPSLEQPSVDQRPPVTGDAAVDEALGRLAVGTAGSLEEQVVAFDAVHRTLQDRLADVEG